MAERLLCNSTTNSRPSGTRGLYRGILSVAVMLLLTMLSMRPSAGASELRKVTIGFQKYGTLIVLKASGKLEQRLKDKGIEVAWAEFVGGIRLLEAMHAGAIDFGTTGDSPPIIAQAANIDFVYAGVEPPSPRGVGILVPKDSPIRTVADLKGKRLAVGRGGNAHHLLLNALDQAGLSTSDVTWSWLLPADGRAAILNGSVDAWSVYDPFLAAAEVSGSYRNIGDGSGADQANYQFYLASRKLASEHPDIVRIILDEIARTDGEAAKTPSATAQLVSTATGIPLDAISLALGRMGYGVGPLSPQIIDDQQKLADLYLRE
jgi:sulfonate transport system substrate-binding protein